MDGHLLCSSPSNLLYKFCAFRQQLQPSTLLFFLTRQPLVLPFAPLHTAPLLEREIANHRPVTEASYPVHLLDYKSGKVTLVYRIPRQPSLGIGIFVCEALRQLEGVNICGRDELEVSEEREPGEGGW